MARRRGWFWFGAVAALLVLAAAIIFRQGVLPAAYTPLPVLDIDRPLPLVVDWQLSELRRDTTLCRRVIAGSDQLSARPVPPRAIVNGCGWRNAVRVSQAGGARIGIRRVSCEVAAALALWMVHDVQPLAQKILNARVVSFQNFGTYSCRNIIGSRFWRKVRSQHATANAIDISSFKLSNGTTVSVNRHWRGSQDKSQFLRAIHQRACSYFRVALSPDFNRAHHDHFHFDRGAFLRCK